MITYISGRMRGSGGRAALFVRANNEKLGVAANAALTVGDIDFTLGCWVRLNSKAADMYIIGKSDLSTISNRRYLLMYENGTDRFRFQVYDGASNTQFVAASTFGSPGLSTWYFLYGYHDSVNNLLGIRVSNGTVDTAAWANGVAGIGSTGFAIGGDQNNAASVSLDGAVDKAFLVKRVLSAGDGQTLYNGQQGVAYGNLSAAMLTSWAAWWELDEASDGTTDVTRNDSHGTSHLASTNTVASTAGI